MTKFYYEGRRIDSTAVLRIPGDHLQLIRVCNCFQHAQQPKVSEDTVVDEGEKTRQTKGLLSLNDNRLVAVH